VHIATVILVEGLCIASLIFVGEVNIFTAILLGAEQLPL